MMKDIFLCLLLNIGKFGTVTTASLYNKDLSCLEIETGDSKYIVSVRREEKNQEEKKDA